MAEFLLIRATADPADPLATAEALMSLARRTNDAALAAEIWYYVGLHYFRAGRTVAARELWSAAAERAETPPKWRRKLREALEETQAE
ncbi:MAG: hypothetical protein D6744_04815 [Planctomycetota bacterium]|nr:MAG: hypothetical protein D6744_04815 [Planctomycetota bacterium]